MEPISSGTSNIIDVAQRGVANAGHQRQRHGVGNVAADDVARFQPGVDQQDQVAPMAPAPIDTATPHPEQRAGGNREGRLAGLGDVGLQLQADLQPELFDMTAAVSSSAMPSEGSGRWPSR
ncbi:hypothetical protein ACVBEH_10145 [Roseateles sp. GG27B]